MLQSNGQSLLRSGFNFFNIAGPPSDVRSRNFAATRSLASFGFTDLDKSGDVVVERQWQGDEERDGCDDELSFRQYRIADKSCVNKQTSTVVSYKQRALCKQANEHRCFL